jgi:small subunit ribosomal protein S9
LAEDFFKGFGTRKKARAQVRLKSGTGSMTINGREMIAHLCSRNLITHALEPLEESKLSGKIDMAAKVAGGGLAGQAGALRLAIARALINMDPDLRASLKQKGFLTRDPRMVERKKYGQVKARKRFQFSKR